MNASKLIIRIGIFLLISVTERTTNVSVGTVNEVSLKLEWKIYHKNPNPNYLNKQNDLRVQERVPVDPLLRDANSP